MQRNHAAGRHLEDSNVELGASVDSLVGDWRQTDSIEVVGNTGSGLW